MTVRDTVNLWITLVKIASPSVPQRSPAFPTPKIASPDVPRRSPLSVTAFPTFPKINTTIYTRTRAHPFGGERRGTPTATPSLAFPAGLSTGRPCSAVAGRQA